MPIRYQDIYPSKPLLDSGTQRRPSVANLLTLEYFKADPAEMPSAEYAQHHILLNLKSDPFRVDNWRGDDHFDLELMQYDIVVTPAGLKSGWRWREQSEVIIVTLDPDQLKTFAHSEVGILLTRQQLADLARFNDPDICQTGIHLKEALENDGIGSSLMFEALARVFLIKLIQRYGHRMEAQAAYSKRFTARQHQSVLEYVSAAYGNSITLEDLASIANLSPAHFSRVFKETIGQSPMQFLTGFRIERAKEALRLQGMPMVEIAMRCGFSDQAHFSRIFKRIEGENPSAWRARQLT